MSSTTKDLGDFRRAVADVLLAAEILPRVQEYLLPDHRKLVTVLRDVVSGCDAVICLVGTTFGAAGQPGARRSYTQIEYDVAHELGKPIYVFLTAERSASDRPATESARRRMFALLEETRRCLPGAPLSERVLEVAALCLEDPPLRAIAAVMGPGAPDGDILHDCAVTLADWSLIGWDDDRQVLRLHPLMREYFAGLTPLDESHAIHDRLCEWYEVQPVPENVSTLDAVRHRLLAIEHSLRGSAPDRPPALCFAPIAGMETLVEWCRTWGHLETGIELLGRLAVASTPRWRPELLTARAALLRLEGRLAEARTDADAAVGLLERDGTPTPDARAALADALVTRGNVHWQGDAALGEAVADYRRVLELLAADIGTDANVDAQAAGVRLNLSVVLREMGRLSDAGRQASTSVEAYRALVSAGATYLAPMMAEALFQAANVQADRDDPAAALASLDEALAIVDDLVGKGRRDLLARLAHGHVLRATVLGDAARPDEALAEANSAAVLLEALVSQGRDDLEWLHAIAMLGRGTEHGRLGRWEQALTDNETAVAGLRRLTAGPCPDLDAVLARALMSRAEARHLTGQRKAAAADREEALETMRRLIEAGNYETRVLLLRKAAEGACALLPESPEAAVSLLEMAADEAAKGLARAEADEALRFEIRRALRRLSAEHSVEHGSAKLKPVVSRLRGLLSVGPDAGS